MTFVLILYSSDISFHQFWIIVIILLESAEECFSITPNVNKRIVFI